MHNLPEPGVYELEYQFLPWGTLINDVIHRVSQDAPRFGAVLDLMCGPGYLLGEIQSRRPDLTYLGIDLDSDYIAYAKRMHPHIRFKTADVRGDYIKRHSWRCTYDVVTCTAGIHHVPYEHQVAVLKRIRSLMSKRGFAVIADPHVCDFGDEFDGDDSRRRLAGAELGYHTLAYAIKKHAPKAVLDAAIEVLQNDVLKVEWKTSHRKQLAHLRSVFGHVEVHKTWPLEETEYGDYYYICRR